MRPFAFALGCLIAASLGLAAPVPKPKAGKFYKPGWDNPVDPDKDCKFTQTSSSLTIEVPGTYHDYYPTLRRVNAPRLLRPVEGDFTVEVRVKGNFHASQQSTAGRFRWPLTTAGLVVEAADKSLASLRLEFGTQRLLGKGEPIGFAGSWHADADAATGQYGNETSKDLYPFGDGAKVAFLRLERRGDRFSFWLSPDGKKWTVFPPSREWPFPARAKVGLIVTSSSDGPLKVTFDQFKLTPLKPAAK
jgi:regulation of enolase protein 1 (concanavalin A-like superfamily)